MTPLGALPDSSPSLALPFEVREKEGGQLGLWSLASWAAGEELTAFGAQATHSRPARLTLQVSEREHIELAPTALSFLNHSCEPSVLVDTTRRVIVALRPLVPGDELTFFYPATEWEMAEPFRCFCGTPSCLGTIAGARDLTAEQLRTFQLNEHIHALLRRERT